MTFPASRIDRRSFLSRSLGAAAGAVAVGAGGGLLAACSSSPARTTAGKSPYGGSLIMATWSEENSLSPPQAHWDSTGYLYGNAIFDTLVQIGADGKAHPYLAESVTPNSDYTEWTVVVRKGVYFHDGTLCDGAAVKGSLDAIRSSLITGSALGPMTGTKLVDPGTVVIQLDQPWVPFASYLASQLGYVAAPAMLRDGSNQGGSNPIGTGPFIFEDWVPNDHLTARKNPHYWQKGYPYLDGITFRPAPDPGLRESALLGGSVQLIHTNYPLTVATFLHNHNFRITYGNPPAGSEPDVDFLMLNCAKAPTDDLDVRRALAMAVNKEQLEATYGAGLMQTVSGPFQPGSAYYAPTPYPSYDPAQASQLIAAYKARTGSAPAIELTTIPGPEYTDVLAIVQQQWSAVGVQVTTNQVETSSFLTEALLGDYQAMTFEQFSATDPDQNFVWWSTETLGPVGGLSLNLARNDDPQIQKALETGRQNPDPEARIDAYKQVANRLAIDLPYIWLGKTLWAAIGLPEVAGLTGQILPDGSESVGFADGVFLLHQLRLNGE
jgi:peptide/nickel transport system substrate-binding protein